MSNLSKQKRDLLIAKIEELKRADETNENAKLLLNEIINTLTEKKYGLLWEKHDERVDSELLTKIPVFSEVKEREICSDDKLPFNFLLEGDNFHSLNLLEKTHKERVDVIYIDPPYNTKNNDFIYNDNIVGVDDTYRHSKWLSFMSNRLQIAQKLLTETGAIFISIDVNEFAQLKLLCDEIFGENNFIGTLIWRKKSGGGQTDEFFVTEHEYIFGYRKSDKFKWYEITKEVDPKEYKFKDKFDNFSITKLEKWGSSAHREDRPTMYFSIKDPDGNDFYPIAPDGKDGRWRVGKTRLQNLIKSDRVYWQKDKKTKRWLPYEKNYLSESKEKLIKSRSILWDFAETGTATKLLTNIFGEKDVFQNPKPIEILKFIFMHTKSDLVLDFFAGSSSTGHAILDLNSSDGGSRKFILCTNNENGICEKISYQRMKTVITGQRKNNSKYSDGIPANLKYYKTDYVKKIEDNPKYVVHDELLKHVVEMIQLEHHIKIDFKRNIILLNDNDAKNFENNFETFSPERVYLEQTVFLSNETVKKLENLGVELISIPEYYFYEH